MALRLEAFASRLEAIALRLEAVGLSLEAITCSLVASLLLVAMPFAPSSEHCSYPLG